MPAVRTTERRAHAETALREIEPDTALASDAVELHPLDVADIHTALQQKILEQSSHRVVHNCAYQRRAQAETAAQTASHVVFAAALPYLERARRPDALCAGIQTEHHFAERENVIFALLCRFDIEHSHCLISFIGFQLSAFSC